jgi:hypothetical protein
MIRHKLPNKTKNATVAEPKLFHQLNNPKDAHGSTAAITTCTGCALMVQ